MGTRTMKVRESTCRNKLSHSFNTNILYVKKWLMLLVNSNGHIWENLMCAAICVIVIENKMSDFSGILISSVDVIKLNHIWHSMEITLWESLLYVKHLFLSLFPVKCKKPKHVKTKEGALSVGGLQPPPKTLHRAYVAMGQFVNSISEKGRTCYIKNSMTWIHWCIQRKREEKDGHRTHECRSPSQLNGHAVAPGSGWICVSLGIHVSVPASHYTYERKLKSGCCFCEATLFSILQFLLDM